MVQSLLLANTGGYPREYHATEGGGQAAGSLAAMSDRRPEGAQQRQKNEKEKVQRQLDEALEDSFPASDPVSIVTSEDEEDWGGETAEPGKSPAPDPKEPSAPKSSRPDSPS